MVTEYSYIRAPTFFLNRGPAWSNPGPAADSAEANITIFG